MSDAGSIFRCVEALKRGDRDGAELIWARYSRRLARAADRRADDEEDVALSALDSVCRGAQRGLRKLEGFTNAEVAAEIGCVEHKLQQIRGLWAHEAEG
jgi:hypothetical protein